MSQRFALSLPSHLSRALQQPARQLAGARAVSSLPRVTVCVRQQSCRPLSTSPVCYKKKSKAPADDGLVQDSGPDQGNLRIACTEEAFDLSILEADCLKALEHLTHELGELRGGGRLAPHHLEKLGVQIKNEKTNKKEWYKLHELAQIIPKGKFMQVVAGDEEASLSRHVKALMSSIRASPYSLAPQPPTPEEPTTITVPIPPITGETRAKAIKAATDAANKATTAIKRARTTHHKKLRKFQLERTILPDDLVKATKLMDDTIKENLADVKKITDSAKKVLDSPQ
ncbi:ribosome recycling factor domain-containing protein [Phyllosticta capitalensis]|uniref:ribosome recycling factor domain-containing protein n=1 Tax=Phyllosticta capitalensis TaxID=121624 RepID=UPI003132212B